ncbi:MAG: hypothetical protein JWM21_3353 [Acidobacteria bacterium]|nr:hypothetical protein [Acidobacteriota bacterium]
MSELDEAWALALAEAQRRAQSAGRGDIAEYLRLRSSNDLQRRTGIDWLLSTFAKLAGDANRRGASLQTTSEEAHRFSVDNATMVGPRLTLTLGVRALSVEAGWPRVPSHSFVRGGGLALGRIKHFGKHLLNQELMLVRSSDGPPSWVAIDRTGRREPLSESSIQSHLSKLLSPDYK